MPPPGWPPRRRCPRPDAAAPDGVPASLRVARSPYAAIPGYPAAGARPLAAAGPATGVPVVVFLHGGGWRLGSRHSPAPPTRADPEPFELVAQAGIAVASVDYRLSGEAVWPAQLHDAKAAVRWLRARADELGVDPTGSPPGASPPAATWPNCSA